MRTLRASFFRRSSTSLLDVRRPAPTSTARRSSVPSVSTFAAIRCRLVARVVRLVRREGLEPSCLAALEPKSGASTNSATFAPQLEKAGRKTTYYNLRDVRSAITRTSRSPRCCCRRALRAPVEVIYRFARSADDIADEGDDPPAVRLAQAATLPASSSMRRPADAAVPATSRAIVRAARRCRCSCSATCSTPSPGRDEEALRRLRRGARLLPPLGQSGRPAAAAPVQTND